MTTIARRIIAEPERSATETWQAIVDLLVPESDNKTRAELLSITGIACSLIVAETIKSTPIVVSGDGPRIRIYGLYGEDAIVAENANESNLPVSPLIQDWTMSLPCLKENLEWVQSAVKKRSAHITVYDMNIGVDDINTNQSEQTASIDMEAFFRP
jgi:hypothetical protein